MQHRADTVPSATGANALKTLTSAEPHTVPSAPRLLAHVLRYNPSCPQTTQPSARDYRCTELPGWDTRARSARVTDAFITLVASGTRCSCPSPSPSCKRLKVTPQQRGGRPRVHKSPLRCAGVPRDLVLASPEPRGPCDRCLGKGTGSSSSGSLGVDPAPSPRLWLPPTSQGCGALVRFSTLGSAPGYSTLVRGSTACTWTGAEAAQTRGRW